MSYNNKVDYIPNQPFNQSSTDNSEQDLKKLQAQKWRVLFGTFILISIISNIWNWTRPAVFESQAILHFAYPSQTELEFSELAQRKVETHQQRLMSNSVIQTTFQKLALDHSNLDDIQNNPQLLTATASGRLITLVSKHEEPELLEPVLSNWIEVYLDIVESEKQKNNSEELLTANTQLQALEVKINHKQEELRLFGELNDITSLERDENRVLNKIKALSASLDQAIAEQTAAQALLNSLNESVKKGQPIIREVDQGQINQTRQELQLLLSELSTLADKYTQAYLARDPSIVKKQQTVSVLEKSLAEQLSASQEYYLQDAARDLATAQDKVKQTQEQFVQQNKKAQIFNQKLQAYKVLSDDLVAIQEQAQNIRNQQVKQEVSQPFDAKISVLEKPNTPKFPSGPDYWFFTMVSLLIAATVSVIALLLFGYIVKQKQPMQTSTNYVVMPGHTVDNSLYQLPQQQTAKLAMQDPYMRLSASNQASSLITLSTEQAQSLYQVANQQAKVLIGLVYSGVAINELMSLLKSDFVESEAKLHIKGKSSRTLILSQSLSAQLTLFCEDKDGSEAIWSHIENEDDFNQMIVNVGHDAEFSFSEQLNLSVLRHSYISYLVDQGVRLNDVEQVVGRVSPSDLAQYRHIKRSGTSKSLAEIELQYPLTA
ncbi:tyrosine-type recombinase/integrase [Paraglaciecola aquimarina]|uniref:Tyrosine-type recombinase/integrase n=1 Tax=Paraglaciecola algarum TaxID=3050085 RepID=A0ABS9D2T2_9ALTE|nr:tyrosine-type recombinase/integrase [Paraglaciecola sp. G1-23]MCF2947223.1 tyrosine-type recombinase/integrase [Paraglaciecola sp. G1-23]